MKRSFLVTVVLVSVALLMISSTGCTKLRARDQLNKGVAAFSNAQYPEAVDHFKQAIELDPEFVTARLYLATAYMSQYIPGAESPENVKMADTAMAEFESVLERSPGDPIALASIASLHFHQKQFDLAEEWYGKLIDADPTNKEAYYTLGVIAWTRAFQPRMEARAEMGMKPEDPGPLKDTEIRTKLKDENLPIIDSGLDNLKKAIEIDDMYDDAMAYLNLLHRERADLMDTKEEYDQQTEMADNWVDKTLETKKFKAAASQSIEAVGFTEE
jgi:tetratricopeptide (TPR) repeat protein